MASVGLGMQMVAGLVAAAAVWETSWALPVGTEVVVDWAAKVAGTVETVEEGTVTASKVAAERERGSLAVEAVVVSTAVEASWAGAMAATAEEGEAAGTMAADEARRRPRASCSRCSHRHSDPQCSPRARTSQAGRKQASCMQLPLRSGLLGSTQADRANL